MLGSWLPLPPLVQTASHTVHPWETQRARLPPLVNSASSGCAAMTRTRLPVMACLAHHDCRRTRSNS